jgi:hypothetical protein
MLFKTWVIFNYILKTNKVKIKRKAKKLYKGVDMFGFLSLNEPPEVLFVKNL